MQLNITGINHHLISSIETNLLGYLHRHTIYILPTVTWGTVSFSIEFHSYQEDVSAKDEGESIENITGFYPF